MQMRPVLNQGDHSSTEWAAAATWVNTKIIDKNVPLQFPSEYADSQAALVPSSKGE